MSRIFEAFNTPRKNGFNEISLQKSFQGRISDRTRTDRCSARTCSRTSSRCARSGRCGFATSGGNWNKHNRRGAAPTIGQCRDPGGWHRPPPASRAGTDGDPALSIVSVERGRASEGGNEGRQSEIDAHNGLTVGEALDTRCPVSGDTSRLPHRHAPIPGANASWLPHHLQTRRRHLAP